MSEEKNNPWRAFLPYDEASASQFKGRSKNIEELLAFIEKERTTVCYAESGVGKSSLINAGLKPKLLQHLYFPVEIVLNLKEKDYASGKLDFDKIAIQGVKDEIARRNKLSSDAVFTLKLKEDINISDNETSELNDKLEDSSLWWLLRTHKIECTILGNPVADYSIIFIFDQFEELFIRSKNEGVILSFFEWYATASSDTVPLEIANELRESSNSTIFQNILKITGTKFLFSLRQDSLGAMDYWVSQRLSIPSLRKNRYYLLPLTTEQAYSVITEQGVDTLNDVANEIIDELKESNNNYVPAIMLSVFCYRLYENAKIGTDGQKVSIRRDEVSANKELLIREYYEELLAKTGIDNNTIFIIEDCLVSSTGKRNRIVNGSSEELNSIGFDKNYRKLLKDNYLINDKVEYIEISHDKVADAIFLRKKERMLNNNLRKWRFHAILIPILLLLCSLLYEIIPSNIVQPSILHEYVQNNDEFLNPYNIGGKTVSSVDIYFDRFFRNIEIDSLFIDSPHSKRIGYFGSFPKSQRVRILELSSVGDTSLKFERCPDLREIELTDSIKYINEDFIVDCPKLKTLKIPRGVTYIDPYAFQVDKLSLEVDSLNENFLWSNGILWNKKDYSIVYIQQDILDATNNRIPFPDCIKNRDSIKYRNIYVFPLDQHNAEILVNKDSTELLFSPAYKLYKSVDLSPFTKVKSIPDRLFAECTDLEFIAFPPSLSEINNEAFRGCSNLKKVSFPQSLNTIGDNAFQNCIALEEIEFKGDSISIYDSAFLSCSSLKTVDLPEHMGKLGKYAFSDCYRLEKVKLPTQISRHIATNTFERCYNLGEFELRDDEDCCFIVEGGCVFKKLLSSKHLLWVTNKPINYKDGDYYSENGFLWERVSRRDSVKSRIVAWNNHSQFDKIDDPSYRKDGWIRVNNTQWTLFDNGDENSVHLPILHRGDITYTFTKMPTRIEELHIPYPQPDQLIKVGEELSIIKRRLDLPLFFRKNITLYVPYKCSKYYCNHPDYIGFKAIKEDGLWKRLVDIIKYLTTTIGDYYSVHRPMAILSFIGIIFLCLVVFILDKSLDSFSKKKRSNKRAFVSAVIFTIFLAPICFMGGYWGTYTFIKCDPYICTVVGCLFCVLMVSILSIMQRVTLSELWKKRKEIWSSLYNIIKPLWIKWKLTKILMIVIVLSLSIVGYNRFDKRYNEYIKKSIETSEQYFKDSTLYKAYSFAYESRIPFSKIRVNATNILDDYEYSVHSASFSPDSVHIITTSGDGTRLYNIKSGKIHKLKVHRYYRVNSATFSQDGNFIVTSSRDNTAMIWDIINSKVLDTLKGHKSSVSSASFSPDSKRIVTASWDDTAIIWDAKTRDIIDTLKGHKSSVSSASFSQDGKRIITASWDNTALIWNAETGDIIDTLKGHKNDINSASFSPDGKRIVTASDDNTAMIWDAETGNIIDTLKGHKDNINSASFSPDGKRIVTASDDNTAMIWDAKTGDIIDTLKGHKDDINSASFSPDGKRIVTASDDNTAMIWDIDLLLDKNKFKDYVKEISKKCPLSDEEKASIGFNYIKWRIPALVLGFIITILLCYAIICNKLLIPTKLLSRKNLKLLGLILFFSIIAGAFIILLQWYYKERAQYQKELIEKVQRELIDNGQYDKASQILYEGLPKRIAMDFIKSMPVLIFRGHNNSVSSANFNRNGKRIITTALWDDISLIWDTKTGDIIDTIKWHKYTAKSASFSPDGKRIVTASWDNTALIWDAKTGDIIDTLKGHKYSVNSASFSPDPHGKRIVTASWDNTAMIWNAETGDIIDTLKGHKYSVNSASFSPDGKRIVTASRDLTAMIWDAKTGDIIDTLKGHRYSVNSASFSPDPDGKRIVTASYDNTALIWDAKTGDIIDTLKGHKSSVSSASFSPDGKRIITASWDNTAMIWDAETGNIIDTLKGHKGDINSASFSPDGKCIITASGDNTAMLWILDDSVMRNYLKRQAKINPLSQDDRKKFGISWCFNWF